MSQLIQIEFIKAVNFYFNLHCSYLNLSKPIIFSEGYISTAIMTGSDGSIELRVGPAEYHVEIFIVSHDGKMRRSLADLISMPEIRNWILLNKPEFSNRSRIDVELEYAFLLISRGLKLVPAFGWIYNKAGNS